MAPNERGACSVCVTLNWECICDVRPQKRRRIEADSDSDVCYDDVVEAAQKMDKDYGVIWKFFSGKSAAVSQAILLETQASAHSTWASVSGQLRGFTNIPQPTVRPTRRCTSSAWVRGWVSWRRRLLRLVRTAGAPQPATTALREESAAMLSPSSSSTWP